MRVVVAAAAAHRQVLLVPMRQLAVQVARAVVAREVRQVAAQPQQEQQERPTPAPVAVAVVIAMIQTHLLRAVQVGQASLLCVMSCPHLQLPT
jgi:hypothetical protein